MKRVLLFGRTGQGKSTIANMLVSGKMLESPVFKMGDGLIGVTEKCVGHSDRDHYVIDTVGLGEDPRNRSNFRGSTDAFDAAVDLITEFLERTGTEYSHILYVKAADRFDRLDERIFKIFQKIFKGTEPAFGLVVTKCKNPDKWKVENESNMQFRFGHTIPLDRHVYVDFEPRNDDPDLESIYERKRQESLDRLDQALDSSFARNGFKYYKPAYVDVCEQDRRKMAKDLLRFIIKDIWDYAKQFSMVSGSVEIAEKMKEMFDGVFSTLGNKVRSSMRDMLLTPEVRDRIDSGRDI
jgi:GTP-binding protein EngB required for normal cell division